MKAIRNLNLRSMADSRVEQYRRILQLIVNVIGQRRKIVNKSVFFATYDQSLARDVLPVVYDRKNEAAVGYTDSTRRRSKC